MSRLGPDTYAAILPVTATFERLAVRYHVGGSVAMSAYGVPRASVDVDLVAHLGLGHVDVLVEQLGDEYYLDRDRVVEAVRGHGAFNLIHLDTMMKVDVFVADTDAFAEQEQIRARRVRLANDSDAPSLPVKSPEDLVLRKLIWYRMGREVSQHQWADVVGLLRVQADDIDGQYLERWAAELRIEDLLGRAIREASS